MPPEAHSDVDPAEAAAVECSSLQPVSAEHILADAADVIHARRVAQRIHAFRTSDLTARVVAAVQQLADTHDCDAERRYLAGWTDAEPFGIPHAVLDCTPAADDVADPAGVEQPSWPTCSACGCCLEHAPGQCVAVHTALCRTCPRNPRVDGV